MRKKYDVIIAYEHKSRELLSICNLYVELEGRGLSVYIYNTYDIDIKCGKDKFYCDVLLMPFGYNNDVLKGTVGTCIRFRKLVNLQWEQVLFKSMEAYDSYKTPSGIFQEYGVHISWGEANRKRLIEKANISSERIFLCGNMAMDFLKRPFVDLYKPKEEVYRRYSLDRRKKICLIISSFKAAFLDNTQLEEECKKYGSSRRLQHELMKQSFDQIIDWIDKACSDYNEYIFVYRPHPGEKNCWGEKVSNKMKELEEHTNFRIIDGNSAQQWVLVSDVIFCGLSTVFADACFANKACGVLVPYELPVEFQMSLFDGVKTLKSERDFRNVLDGNNDFSFSSNSLKDFYSILDEYSFIKVADCVEKVRKDDSFAIPNDKLSDILNEPFSFDLKFTWIRRVLVENYYFRCVINLIGRLPFAPASIRMKYLSYKKDLEIMKSDRASANDFSSILKKLIELRENVL